MFISMAVYEKALELGSLIEIIKFLRRIVRDCPVNPGIPVLKKVAEAILAGNVDLDTYVDRVYIKL